MKHLLFRSYYVLWSCRNGAKGAEGGGLESADWPARGSPTSIRGQDTSWWPGAHTSAPKAPSIYEAESRSEVSKGLGWVGKQVNGWSLCRPDTGGESEDRWRRRKAESEKESGNRPDHEKLVSLNYPCHSATPLRHISCHISRHDSRHCGPNCHARTKSPALEQETHYWISVTGFLPELVISLRRQQDLGGSSILTTHLDVEQKTLGKKSKKVPEKKVTTTKVPLTEPTAFFFYFFI